VRTVTTGERFLKDERGFTLVEMIITTMIMMIVLVALFSVFDTGLKVFSFSNNKVEAVETARVGLEKMEREIRQAYVYNRAGGDMHVFDTWTADQIRFGNDLDGSGIVQCPNPGGKCEKIGYELNGTTLVRDNSSTGADFQPVAENIQGLTFTYYDNNGNVIAPGGTETSVDRVSVRLAVSVDQGIGNNGTQVLTTVIDLRNR
jgi:type II secretory pathway component PulJ